MLIQPAGRNKNNYYYSRHKKEFHW